MKKYKKITQIQELQQRLDRVYGKGLYKAGFVLLLFGCLFLSSCVPDSRSIGISPQIGRQEIPAPSSGQGSSSSSPTTSSKPSSNTSSSEARIKITDPNQKSSPSNLYGSDPAVLDAYFAREDTESGAYKRINSAAIGDTVFIVVDTANLMSRTLKVTVKDKNEIIKGTIPFLQYKSTGDSSFEEKPAEVNGEFSAKVRNHANDQRFALYKIDLKAKDDKITTQWKEDIKKHKDKKLMLYLTVTVENEDNVIYCGSNFKDENQRATDKENNVWLNMDKKWFEVNILVCNCGETYKDEVTCVKYSSNYGPLYNGNLPIKDYSEWATLIKENTITSDEKDILIAMSENEGNFDTVQGYDSEIITVGAMQKTINSSSYGELPIQLWKFKEKFPTKYKCLLEDCKWEIEAIEIKNKKEEVIKTEYKAKYDGKEGQDLKNLIREGFTSDKNKQIVRCKPIEPLIELTKDSDYQAIQIDDFIIRMNNALKKKPKNHTSYKISDFIHSNLGKAMVLDHDVNRPGHVINCFGDSLDEFFQNNSSISKNPTTWGEKHSEYETKILEIYGPKRGTSPYTMTDATKRYNNLKNKL